MAKQLSSKVERCPKCGVLKSKSRACKRCGYGTAAPRSAAVIDIKLAGYDMTKYSRVVINGVEYHK